MEQEVTDYSRRYAEDLCKRLTQAQNKITALESENAALRAEIAKRDAMIHQLGANAAKAAREYSEEVARLRAQIEADRDTFRDADIIDDPIGAAAQLEAAYRNCDAILSGGQPHD